jgi:hypothetical protein
MLAERDWYLPVALFFIKRAADDEMELAEFAIHSPGIQ